MKILTMENGEKVQLITEALYQGREMLVYQELKEPFSVFVVEKEAFGKEESFQKQEGSVSIELPEATKTEEKEASSLIERFLDAQSYRKKIEILEGEEKVDESVLELMATVLDETLQGNSWEEKYDSLLQILRMKARFEVDR